jgi:alkylation response protein AidB-like acyl-CoA dehydrogenase
MTEWTEEQRDLRDGIAPWCEAFSEGHLARDGASEFDPRVWKLVRESSILGLPFQERWGGLGQDLPTTMYVLEEFGRRCRDGGLSFSISTQIVSAGIPLQRFGSERLKERYLPGICDGGTVTAHAITEPDSGSDALAMRTRARPDGDGWILDGGKTFITNAPIADLITVYARTDPDRGPLGITAFLVERGTPGLTIGPPMEKMGLKTSPLAEVHLDSCPVPHDRVLGRPGLGFLILDHVMKWEILLCFVIALGEMQHRLERCLAYAKERRQFGKPIGSYQSVANKLVDMKIGIETARLWMYETARRLQDRQDVQSEIAVCKLLVSEANLASALSAVQIFGGSGYMAETGLEKDLRDAVGGTIYSGTSDIQRNRIAAMLGL